MFCWHEIGYGHPAIDDRLVVSPEQFAEEIAWIRERFRIVSCGDAAGYLDHGVPREPLAVLTFDDGFVGVRDYGVPILTGVPWTAYLNSGMLTGAVGWKQRATYLLRLAPMTDRERTWVLGLKASFSEANLCQLETLWERYVGEEDIASDAYL